MLAGGPWYTSATTIGWTAIGVAVVFGVVTIALWRLGIPRRLLIYTTESTSLLLASDLTVKAASDIKVTLRDKVVNDPYLVTLTVDSRSRRDIRASDFDDGKPLLFHIGAPIVAASRSLGKGQRPPNLTRTGVSADLSQILRIDPALIRRGQWFRLTLLTEGEPSVTHESPIADVTVRKGTTSILPQEFWVPLVLAMLMLSGGLILGHPHLSVPLVLVGIGLISVASLATGWISRTLRLRKP